MKKKKKNLGVKFLFSIFFLFFCVKAERLLRISLHLHDNNERSWIVNLWLTACWRIGFQSAGGVLNWNWQRSFLLPLLHLQDVRTFFSLLKNVTGQINPDSSDLLTALDVDLLCWGWPQGAGGGRRKFPANPSWRCWDISEHLKVTRDWR